MERECAWRAASRSSAVFFAHPNYGLPCVLSGLWDEALVFGGFWNSQVSERILKIGAGGYHAQINGAAVLGFVIAGEGVTGIATRGGHPVTHYLSLFNE